MEKFFYLILACLFAGLLFYIHRLRRQVRWLGKFTQFFYGAASALGMLTVGYEVGRDVATLSPDCARLFHLPEELPISHAAGRRRRRTRPIRSTPSTTASAPLPPIRPISTCAAARRRAASS